MENARLIFGLWIAVLLLVAARGEKIEKLEDAMINLRRDPVAQESILDAVIEMQVHHKASLSDNNIRYEFGEDSQVMIVSPLKIVSGTKIAKKYTFKVEDASNSKLYRNKFYSYLKSNNKDCDASCRKSLNSILTRKNSYDKVEKGVKQIKKGPFTGTVVESGQKVHTELQFMYGKIGKELLDNNKKQIILIYSKYIPCAQLSNGFGECSADLGNFLAAKRNTGHYYFIVVYDTNVDSDSSIAEIYMSESGIASFTIDTTKTNRLVQSKKAEKLQLDYTQSLSLPHNYHSLPRIHSKDKPYYTPIQVLDECLARNFLSSVVDGSISKVYKDRVNQATSYNLERQFYQYTSPFDPSLKMQIQLSTNNYYSYLKHYQVFLENGNGKGLAVLQFCAKFMDRFLVKGKTFLRKTYGHSLPNWYRPTGQQNIDPKPQINKFVSCPQKLNVEEAQFLHDKVATYEEGKNYPRYWHEQKYLKSEPYHIAVQKLAMCKPTKN